MTASRAPREVSLIRNLGDSNNTIEQKDTDEAREEGSKDLKGSQIIQVYISDSK